MEIEFGYEPEHQNVKINAYWTNVHIDTMFPVGELGIETYQSHLKDCEKNPTIGMLAREKYITGRKAYYPEYARRNARYMERQPEIDELRKSVNQKIERLYPKTKKIREYIIGDNRISLDYVKQHKKYDIVDKILIMCKKLI